jgi:hypothetical protein
MLYVICIVSKLLRGGLFQVRGVVWKEGQSSEAAAQHKKSRLGGVAEVRNRQDGMITRTVGRLDGRLIY